MLFGAETDSYDRVGKIVRRAPNAHTITREAVEKALAQFRGKVMQFPPIFSALKVQGKKLYEYAREGQVPPIEIQPRKVEVSNLEILEWYEPGEHEFKWPEEEAPEEEKSVAEKLLAKDDSLPVAPAAERDGHGQEVKLEVKGSSSAAKRKSPPAECPQPEKAATEEEPNINKSDPAAKKQKVSTDSDAAQPTQDTSTEQQATNDTTTNNPFPLNPSTPSQPQPFPSSPAVKITMTVSSGFYVRSLAHDLGKALGSCGFMSELIRTRQGDFELGPDKVLEYKDLDTGEEVWGPKVQRFLEEWEKKRGGKAREGVHD